MMVADIDVLIDYLQGKGRPAGRISSRGIGDTSNEWPICRSQPWGENLDPRAARLYVALAFPSGMGQTRDMTQLTTSPIRQPRSTSATLCSPCSTPVNLEW